MYTSFVVAWGLLELVFPRLELLGTIVLGDVDIIVVKLASLVKTEVLDITFGDDVSTLCNSLAEVASMVTVAGNELLVDRDESLDVLTNDIRKVDDEKDELGCKLDDDVV